MILPILAFAGIVTSVHDGDTFRLADGTRVRLAAIDANELDGSCHNACAPLSAEAARRQLAALALGRRATCEQTGTSYARVVAFCRVGPLDLSCALVRAGAAVRWPRYDMDHRLCHGRIKP